MLILNRDTELALNILQLLHEQNYAIPAWEIAHELEESLTYTQRILARLKAVKMVTARQGRSSPGYTYVPTSITLASFLLAFSKWKVRNQGIPADRLSEVVRMSIYNQACEMRLMTEVIADRKAQ